MTENSLLLSDLDAGVLMLTFNRPETLNALNAPLLAQLREALIAASTDTAVRVLVLRGSGRGFSSGGDLKEGATPRPPIAGPDPQGQDPGFEEWADLLRHAMDCSRLLHQMPKPTVAMIRGPAAGAGLALAAACDLRIASDTALFTTAFIKVGFSGDFGITYFLTRLVGTAKARELMFLSDKIDAAEALRIGLVNRVTQDRALHDDTLALARRIADGPAIAYRYMKRNLDAAEHGALESILDMEALHLTRTRMTADHREAAAAFAQKRTPKFTHK